MGNLSKWTRPIRTLESVNGCQIVISHYDPKFNYPILRILGKRYRLNRLVYELKKGKIPEGLVVRHKCDNRLCINIEHLEVGTRADNSNDMFIRGRSTFGIKSASAKLSELEAKEILNSKLSQRKLAIKFNVSRWTISDLKKGITWKHLRGELNGSI